MPIYEEKLISPLAIRFTQQRIRQTFRDGREIEATCEEITTGPAVGDYDVVLHAPFPTIEIIRYSPHGRSASGQGDDDHWFTFDNRRLYCLQRIAASHWPKRVGASVEVLYADTGAIRKKFDSMTCGISVSIGHAFAVGDELDEWDWHQDVEERAPPGLALASNAEAGVFADDAKTSVSDLMEAPGVPSSFDRLAKAFAASELAAAVPLRSRTISEDSTAAPETPEELTATWGEAPDESAPSNNPLDSLVGVWTGDKKETYTISSKGCQWHCVREDSYTTKKFTLLQDKHDPDVLWWGIQMSYYVCISEFAEKADQLRWYKATDEPGRRPRFMWNKSSDEWSSSWPQDGGTWSAWQGKGDEQVKKDWAPKPQVRQTKWQSKTPQPANQQRPATQQKGKWVQVANSGGA